MVPPGVRSYLDVEAIMSRRTNITKRAGVLFRCGVGLATAAGEEWIEDSSSACAGL
jgi:hypothetical protein